MSIHETEPVIKVRDLRKSFDDTTAVDGLSFDVEAGSVLGLLGPNGAGKTTTIKMLTTLLTLDGGSASVAGFDVASQPQMVRQTIGLAGQAAAVDEKLTARENLDLFGRLYHLPSDQRTMKVEELIRQFDLTEFADRPVETLSGGQRRRLDVVASLIADPPALFLDEPTTGLDPRSRAEIWEAIRSLAARGTAVVLTTQYLDEADRLSDNIVVIDRGRVVGTGTAAELKSSLERDVLEVTVAEPSARDRAADLLDPSETVVVDDSTLHLPVNRPVDSLAALRRVDDAGIEIADFQLRKPTLDDVFLTLTGEPTS
ncbi:MAG: ATP-binding cassette domain-containing protein [Acidimicrobiia bacterium]